MGIKSEEAIALGRIADKLQSLDNTMQKIEKDLHSIDISLGAMKPKTINDIRQKYGFEPVPDIDELARRVVYGDECESEISKHQAQMAEKVISDKEDNNETRN